MKKNPLDKNSSRRDVLRYAGLIGVVGFSGFEGLNFGSEPAIAAPNGTPEITGGISPGTHPVSPYDIEYQRLDTTSPIMITYIFTDSGGNETKSTHSVSLSGEPSSGTVNTGIHNVKVPSGDVQLAIEVSHPSLPKTLPTDSSAVVTILADASIIDKGNTVLDEFKGQNYSGEKSVSSYDINYNGLDTDEKIEITYTFTDSDGSIFTDKHSVSLSGKSKTDTVSTGSHSISIPEGVLDLDIELSHTSLENSHVTNLGSVGEVYPDVLDATGGTTVVDKKISGQEYRIHAFENVGSETFTVNRAPSGSTIDVLIVGGGGGAGGNDRTGGGGAGGLIFNQARSVTVGDYNVKVGGGGAGGPNLYTDNLQGYNGDNSEFDNLTAFGGGGGGSSSNFTGSTEQDTRSASPRGRNGGSGGGAGNGREYDNNVETIVPGGNAISGQGNPGGSSQYDGRYYHGGGGGGFAQPGQDRIGNTDRAGDGGDGGDFSAEFGTGFGENGFFAGGGAGGVYNSTSSSTGDGGIGGGGDTTQPGFPNTGGGGGGPRKNSNGNAVANAQDGGSGIVLIRYKI